VHFPRGAPVFVIPLEWNNHQASLVISLRDNSLSNTAAAELDLKSLADDEVVEA
jgi:hypothetical protein